MSLDINLYVADIDDLIIPKWMEELNNLGMTCEIHPEFSFRDHSGFLPFKINIHEGSHEELMNETYLTGFELYIHDFDLQQELKPFKKQSWIEKLTNKPAERIYFANPEIDEVLKNCKKNINFNWGVTDAFELRMASVGSATLAKVTGGVCSYPADNIWYNTDTVVDESIMEVIAYEKSLNPREFRVHKFIEWH